MPQASDELRDEMGRLFGDRINDYGPTEFLLNAGYKLQRDWTWIPRSDVFDERDMTRTERMCVLFLIDEWDMGGVWFKEYPERISEQEFWSCFIVWWLTIFILAMLIREIWFT